MQRLLLLATLPLAACTSAAAVERVELGAGGLSGISVPGMPGRLEVVGQADRDLIEARVRLYDLREEDDELSYLDTALEDTGADDADIPDQLSVRLSETASNLAELRVGLGWLDPRRFEVRTKVWVPQGFSVTAAAVEGDTELKDVGSIDLLDASGDILVKRAEGTLSISDDNGSIRVLDSVGTVDIVDAGGRVVVKDIEGDVTIRDGKGAIKVRRVSGKVTVWDTEGALSIEDVGERELHLPGDG